MAWATVSLIVSIRPSRIRRLDGDGVFDALAWPCLP
jgi:hypothetical protein